MSDDYPACFILTRAESYQTAHTIAYRFIGDTPQPSYVRVERENGVEVYHAKSRFWVLHRLLLAGTDQNTQEVQMNAI